MLAGGGDLSPRAQAGYSPGAAGSTGSNKTWVGITSPGEQRPSHSPGWAHTFPALLSALSEGLQGAELVDRGQAVGVQHSVHTPFFSSKADKILPINAF